MKPVISAINNANNGNNVSKIEYLTTVLGIDNNKIAEATKLQQNLGTSLERTLLSIGALEENQLPYLYAKLYNATVLSSKAEVLDSEKVALLLPKINSEFLLSAGAVPVALEANTLSLAISTLEHWSLVDYLRLLPFEIDYLFCTSKQLDLLKEQYEINWQTAKHNQVGQQYVGEGEIERLKELAQGAPTVSFVNHLISEGVKLGASDLHIEPVASRYRARYRVDGILHEADAIPQNLQLAVISRIKILSGMDIAEKRRPQDGKIETRANNIELDIRCSSLPLGEGESMVMRFLIKSSVQYDLATLGYESDLAERIQADLKKTAGVILMTGPTGSGKTTSLYSYLNQLNRPEVKIITLEDPIEYQLEGINQVQINNDIGFDFAKGLRSIVRQDPDVIMVGEIRDNETARIALQSALTGHLVFSTVHTNDAATAYTRLLDLGVQEYLLNAALVSILAQRLVRKLCSCAQLKSPEEIAALTQQYDLSTLAEKFNVDDIELKNVVGCDKCGHTGFQGRVALLEYLPCDNEIKQMPKGENFFKDAAEYMQSNNLRSLKQDGYLKAIKGQTTLEEVLRVAG
ncbi:GspE/PulE family protein [Colwellia sp. E2M01]|uniref:GspE/PulE family protein n=1 Tax=Colwellia sp. E2M01 TaxID=2841561 RepID=UPI001C0A3E45|nr:GspE/PulE family protein [Colwellia sp. E2M01]MBU2869353.1 GspE/PulE family protein [Colwellia sp. E2M01]